MADSAKAAIYYQDGEFSGHLGALYSCVFAHLDQGYEVFVVPQARLLKQLQAGKVDIAMPPIKPPFSYRIEESCVF